MKISASDKYPGFNFDLALVCEVYLNGELLYNCIAADSDCGTAVCFKSDKNNKLIKTEDGEFATEIKRGNVCIFVPEEYQGLL